MEKNQKLNKIIAMWAPPRSVSTAFERMIMERGDFSVFHEPFSADYYLGPERKSARFPDKKPEPGHHYLAALSEILEAARARPVFFKDMAYHAARRADPEFLANFENIFLIRDPAKALPSLFHMWPDFKDDETGYEALLRIYETASGISENPPLVIDSDDLLKDPAEVVKGFCRALDLPFIPEALEWKPEKPPEWKIWDGWHTEAEQSRGFEKSPAKKYLSIHDHPRLKQAYQNSLPIYQKLYQQRLKIG